jgi:hypothetical protein
MQEIETLTGDRTHAPDDAIAVVSPPAAPLGAPDLIVTRAPELVLAEAQRAARALKDVLDAKPRKVILNGERYLEFEDWQTLGRFYGVTAKVTSSTFVEYGAIKGFSATAVALRPDGFELGAAEAACLSDEPKWRSRPVYEWRDTDRGRQRIPIGEEPVPLFQLKSMAQTRACAKAFRSVLAWIVVLAGYRPTPAEELLEADPPPTPDAPTRPRRDPPPPRAARAPARRITKAQQHRLFAEAKARAWPLDDLRAHLRTAFHVAQTEEILASDFENVLALVLRGPTPHATASAPVAAPSVDDIPF